MDKSWGMLLSSLPQAGGGSVVPSLLQLPAWLGMGPRRGQRPTQGPTHFWEGSTTIAKVILVASVNWTVSSEIDVSQRLKNAGNILTLFFSVLFILCAWQYFEYGHSHYFSVVSFTCVAFWSVCPNICAGISYPNG